MFTYSIIENYRRSFKNYFINHLIIKHRNKATIYNSNAFIKISIDFHISFEIPFQLLIVMAFSETDFNKANKYCCLNVPIALTPCDEEASRLEFIEESCKYYS